MARKLKDYDWVSLKPEDMPERIDFAQVFGRSAPVHIEIGSGKGTFLVAQAKAQPDINFLGIEWASKYYRHAVDRIGRWGLTNIRLIRTAAADLLAEFIPPAGVQCFHIYFPDPWPKKRHHKRRFICADNLDKMLRLLQAKGRIQIATDHAEYFTQIQEVLAAKDGSIERIEFVRPAGATGNETVGTNFERKYLKEDRPIYTTAVRKL